MTDQLLTEAAASAAIGDRESRQEVLDFLVTEEQLGVTFVTAAIQNAPGTPSEAFVPVLRNAVTTEFHHVEALKDAGGRPLTTRYWFPDAGVRRRRDRPLRDARGRRDHRDQPVPARRQRVRAGRRGLRRPSVRRGDGDRGRAPRARALRPGPARQGRRRAERRRLRELRLAERRRQVRASLEALGIGYGVESRPAGPVLRVPRRPARERRRHAGQPHRFRCDHPGAGAGRARSSAGAALVATTTPAGAHQRPV